MGTGSFQGRWRYAMAAAVLLGLVVRLAFALGYWRDKPMTNDEHEYALLAGSLARGEGYRYPESEAVAGYDRAPGYPLFLAPLVGPGPVPASVPVTVKAVQCVIGALGVLAVGLLARSVAGDRAGIASAAIAAIYQPLVWMSGFALSEVLYSPMILIAATAIAPLTDGAGKARPAEGVGRALGVGALLGAAALVRPSALVFLGLAFLWLALRRRALRAAAALAVGAALLILPWTARNIAEHGRFVLIASEGGITFWTGNHPLSPGDGDMAANVEIKRANLALRQQYAGLTQTELEAVYYREALKAIAADPAWWVGLLAKKFFYTWVPIGPSYKLHSGRHYALTLASYLLTLPFAVAGFVRLVRRGPQPVALWLLGGSAVFTSVLFLSTERYRIPVIDPVLIVCAGTALAGFWREADSAVPGAARSI